MKSMRQRGLSLVELMVALALSAVVIVATAQLYLGDKQSLNQQDETMNMQEEARYALDLLGRAVRLSGYDPQGSDLWHRRFSQKVADCSTDGSFPLCAQNDTGLNQSDSVKISFWGMSLPGSELPEGGVVDCLGRPKSANELTIDHFYIAAHTTGDAALFCQSATQPARSDDASVLLVPGVYSVQMLLLESDEPQGVPMRSRLANMSGLSAYVVGVQLSLLMRSQQAGMGKAVSMAYNHFGQAYAPQDLAPSGDSGAVVVAPADTHAYRLVSTVVGVRN
jgi:type IV pilus assembly protein PilW